MNEINFYYRKEEYGWLSNFERIRQVVDGIVYPTNEHFYQSQKAKDPVVREWIRNAPSPYLAMVAGRGLRRKEIVEDWDNKKVEVMLEGLRAKFSEIIILKERLLATGGAIIHEDNPTDIFWGKIGKDMLGKLLMQVREEIKNEKCPK